MEVRFKFKIDPKVPLFELVPAPPKTTPNLPVWTNEDLAKVPELTFGEPISKELTKHKAMEGTAHVMAKINHLNTKKRDGFMLAMIERRPDLRGLPFLMGDDCRTREDQAKVFALAVETFRQMPIERNNKNTDLAKMDLPDAFLLIMTAFELPKKWRGSNPGSKSRCRRASVEVF